MDQECSPLFRMRRIQSLTTRYPNHQLFSRSMAAYSDFCDKLPKRLPCAPAVVCRKCWWAAHIQYQTCERRRFCKWSLRWIFDRTCIQNSFPFRGYGFAACLDIRQYMRAGNWLVSDFCACENDRWLWTTYSTTRAAVVQFYFFLWYWEQQFQSNVSTRTGCVMFCRQLAFAGR